MTREDDAMIDPGAVGNLLMSWWYDYDQGDFDTWPAYFTADAHFSCRSDTGQTDYEEFIRADISGRDELLVWQEDHRRNSPYPLRHHGLNVHVTRNAGGEADFRSYLFVTQIVAGVVTNLSTGIVLGTVRDEGGSLRLADLRVILDTMESEVFGPGARPIPA
jgi:hypothetical protein